MIEETISGLWWRRFARREACSWEELEQFPKCRPDERRRILSERLLGQVQYFGNRTDALAEWREAAKIRDPADLWKIWSTLPIVTKQTLQAQFPAEELQSRFRLQGTVRSTGGSTGEPTVFFHDTAMMRATNAASTYTRTQMGWHPGMATVKIWGSERDIQRSVGLRTRIYNRLLREIVLDGYGLTDDTVTRVAAAVRKQRPVAMWGFTSMLEFVAKRLVERGECLPAGWVRTAWNGGEMLFAEQVEIFRKAFGIPIFNRYGGRELSVMACQYTDGGPLFAMRPWLFLEVVNEKGLPAAPGESGRLLWTSTICRGTPFLRYEIGDLGTFLPAHLDESGIGALQDLQGRTAGLITLRDGRKINCIFWNHLFKEFSEVEQFQVVIRDGRQLHILLKGGGFTAVREHNLRDILLRFLGSTPVDLEWVSAIPVTRHGKLVQVVRERSD